MTLEQLPLIMLRALVLTVVIEVSVAWLAKVRNRRDLIVVALVNVLTNPLVVSIGAAIALFIGYSYFLPIMIILEITALLVEASIYKKTLISQVNPFLLSLMCNGTSYIIGEFLNHYVF